MMGRGWWHKMRIWLHIAVFIAGIVMDFQGKFRISREIWEKNSGKCGMTNLLDSSPSFRLVKILRSMRSAIRFLAQWWNFAAEKAVETGEVLHSAKSESVLKRRGLKVAGCAMNLKAAKNWSSWSLFMETRMLRIWEQLNGEAKMASWREKCSGIANPKNKRLLGLAVGAQVDVSSAHAQLFYLGSALGAGLLFHVWSHGWGVAALLSIQVLELVFSV